MSQLRSVRLGHLIAALVFALPALLSAQTDTVLHFNVPYKCPNGSIYVIHKCEKGPKFEACTFQRDQNSEAYNVRSAVENLIRSCQLVGSANAASPVSQQPTDLQINTPYQCPGGITVTLFQCQKQNGQDYCFVKLEQNGQFITQVPKLRAEAAEQLKACKPGTTFNPPYLSEFPSVNRIIQGMQASTPSETVPRSIGALYQLSEVIQTLAQQRGGSLLPDETKLLDTYTKAISNLITVGAQKLPGQQLSLASNPYHFARNDPRFGFDGIPMWVTFLSPSLQTRFAQLVGGNNQAYNAKVELAKQAAVKNLNADMAAAQAAAKPMRQDAGSVAMRTCMESGRSDMECLGEGMKVGLVDLAGGKPLEGILPQVRPGLRLTGVYSTAGFSVGFDQTSVNLVCGKLVPQPYTYTVEHSGTQVNVTVPISPRPLSLSFKPDGKLVGPGPVDVAGRVVIGGATSTTSTSYEQHTETTTQQRQIDAGDVANYSADSVHQNGMEYSVDQPVTTTSYTAAPVRHVSVPTAPKTERCNVTVLPATASNVKISDVLTQMFGTEASKASNSTPGLRLAGTYSQPGGLSIEFRGDSATIGCGEAHNAVAYSVVPAGGQLAVRLQNGSSPFTLVLQADGTLAGSGAVDVAGRKLVPSANNDVHNFIPVNARCAVGILKPGKN